MTKIVFMGIHFLLVFMLIRLISMLSRQKKRVGTFLILGLLLFDFYILLWTDCSLTTVIYMLLISLTAAMKGQLHHDILIDLDHAVGKYRFVIFILSLLTALLLLFIYLPITIFLTSPEETKIHLDYLFITNIGHVMAIFYLAVIAYTFLFHTHFKTLFALLSTALLMTLILYSYALPFGYPMMNGLTFEQMPVEKSVLILRCILDVVLIPGIFFLSYYLMRHKRVLLVQCIVIINISLTAATLFKITEKEIHYFDESRPTNVQAFPVKYSKEGRNVLILILDRLMGGFVEKILENDPSLNRKLDGFTWYPRTISAGINSISGLHGLLGGYDYTPREMNRRKGTLLEKATESFAILPYNFVKKGYQVNWVNPKGLGFTRLGDCSCLDMTGVNCTHIPTNVSIDMAKTYDMPTELLVKSSYSDLMVLLGAMRSAPYAYKNVLNKKGPWMPFLKHTAGTTFKEWSELKALPQLSTNGATTDCLNIVLNILPHEPYFIGKDCLPTKEVTRFSEVEIKSAGFPSLFAYQHFLAAQCAIQLTVEYLEWMKENGVYDNTKIIVVSDHGIVGDTSDPSSRAKQGGTTHNMFVSFRSALFVKERNQKGVLRISEQFTPNTEVPEIACQEIGGCVNPYLDDKPIRAFGRDDPFHVAVVPWQFNKQEEYRFHIDQEFVIVGKDPYLLGNWRKVESR